MLPYGSKINSWNYVWISKDRVEIVVSEYHNKLSRKRARRQNKEIINSAIYEIMENKDLDDLDRIAEMYGDYYEDCLFDS